MENPRRNHVSKEFFTMLKGCRMYDRKDEHYLITLAQSGDRRAVSALANGNMLFVVKVANMYRTHEDVNDLIQVGAIGLNVAIMKFDVTSGYKFISYAVWWIRQHITKYIQDHGCTVRMPANKFRDMVKWVKAVHDNDEKVLESLDQQEMSSLYEMTKLVNMDSSVNDDSNDTLHGSIGIEDVGFDEVFEASTKKLVLDYVNTLGDREKMVIKALYGVDDNNPQSMREVSRLMGISHERVRQLRSMAEKRIKKLLVADGIVTHLNV